MRLKKIGWAAAAGLAGIVVLAGVASRPASLPPSPGVSAGRPGASTVTAEFKVDGMFCSLCAASLARVLADHPGVTAARVQLEEELALVQYDPAAITPEEVEAMIEETGVFHAELVIRPLPTEKP